MNGTHTVKRTIIGQLERGTDLYEGIMHVLRKNNISLGRVTGMGAVQRATVAYFDQKQMKYSTISFNEPMEILSLYGNVSVKDGEPFAHVHVVLSDEKGNGKGGHLLPSGSPVFACELIIEEFEGAELIRKLDPLTGLSLWPEERTL